MPAARWCLVDRFSEHLHVTLIVRADPLSMPSPTRIYELGPARDLDRERPTMADLQRARAHALRSGDLRRATAYGLLVDHRVRAAQRDAEAA
jgi:hypothetical protein